jgi:hypothetical protein
MNKNILLIPIIGILSACSSERPQPVSRAPVCPELPVEVTQKQPPLEDITDPTMGGLVLEIVKLTQRTKIVENKLDTSINLYNKCRQLAIDYNKQSEKQAK